jgi:hypothetical protein
VCRRRWCAVRGVVVVRCVGLSAPRRASGSWVRGARVVRPRPVGRFGPELPRRHRTRAYRGFGVVRELDRTLTVHVAVNVRSTQRTSGWARLARSPRVRQAHPSPSHRPHRTWACRARACRAKEAHPRHAERTTGPAPRHQPRSLSSVPTDHAADPDHAAHCSPSTYAPPSKISPTTTSSTSTTRSTSAIVVVGPIKAML